jgi:hypothetical protein
MTRFASRQHSVLRQQGTNKSSSAVLLSAEYQADRTRMSNTRPNVPFGTGGEYIFNFCNFGRLQLPGWTFSKCPAERKALTLVITLVNILNL